MSQGRFMKPSTRCRITELAETLLKMLGSSPLPERGHTRWHGLSGVATLALLTSLRRGARRGGAPRGGGGGGGPGGPTCLTKSVQGGPRI